MEREMAEQVVSDLKKKDCPQLTLLEAMAMTKVMTDGDDETFAIQKGFVMFLASKHKDGTITTTVQYW